MADLKTLLGDKYKDGMTIDELMALEVEEPKADTTAYDNLKKRLDEVASEAANYKKQLRATLTEAEQKALAEAEEKKALQDRVAVLEGEKAIAEHSKGLVAIGYDEKTATEVATALMNGDFATVIKAQATFVDAQKKAVIAEKVKETPIPPVGNGNETVMTKEKLKAMTPNERFEFSQKNPEEYKKIYGG